MVDKLHSSDSEEQTNPRKRSRMSIGAEEGPNKKRGRPRVDTQDATAADRRRTQIRLAQRAYRQRKETTISSLKKRVSGLEGVVEQMNQAFLRFNDSALKSGILALRPELAKELNAATEMFVQLARETAANADQDDDEEGLEEVPSEPAAPKSQPQPRPQPEPQSHPQHNISIIAPSFAQQEQDHLDMGFGYAQMFQGREQSLHQRDAISSFLSGLPNDPPPPPPAQHHSHHTQDMLPFGLVPHDQHASYQVNTASVPSPPHLSPSALSPYSDTPISSSPYTYSFQETSFARRLQRYSLERAYQLVSSKAFRPARFEKVFRLSLLTASPGDIQARFHELLRRGPHESLENWDTPFVRIGGAGTHYPRRDAVGNTVPIVNGWTVRRIGPVPYRGRLCDESGRVQDIDLDLRELEGEWFDAHDVQGYLEEKGCRIDPTSSFADALIDVGGRVVEEMGAPLAMDLGVGAGNSGMGAERRASPWGSVDGSAVASLTSRSGSYSRSEENEVQTPNVSESDLGFSYGFQTAGFFDQPKFGMGMDAFYDMSFPTKPNKSKRSVTIDVQKLCEELVNRCVCLGRSPGFRPHDVDAAFNVSIISAF